MRGLFAIVVLAGCASDGIDAPDDCTVDQLHVIHGTSEDSVTIMTHIFVNKISDDPGSLAIGTMGSDFVSVEFDSLIANGDQGDARGYVQLTSGLDAGNCDTASFSGKLFVDNGYYRFELNDLHAGPDYCSGAAVDGTIGGCYRSE
jgi:hypothetical protein